MTSAITYLCITGDSREAVASVDYELFANAATAAEREAFVRNLINYVEKASGGGGALSIIARMETGNPKATGTITYTGTPVADETLTVNGVVLTFKASAATQDQITITADNTQQARLTSLVINAHTKLVGVVTATSALGVVTVEAVALGTAGQALTLAESATGTAVSGATLTGGVASATVTVSGTPVADETLTIGGKVLTFKAASGNENEITISADNTVQATNITTIVNANSVLKGLVLATSAAGVVTLSCTEPGRIGNIITLAEAATGVAVSGAALSGATATQQRAPLTYNFGGV